MRAQVRPQLPEETTPNLRPFKIDGKVAELLELLKGAIVVEHAQLGLTSFQDLCGYDSDAWVSEKAGREVVGKSAFYCGILTGPWLILEAYSEYMMCIFSKRNPRVTRKAFVNDDFRTVIVGIVYRFRFNLNANIKFLGWEANLVEEY